MILYLITNAASKASRLLSIVDRSARLVEWQLLFVRHGARIDNQPQDICLSATLCIGNKRGKPLQVAVELLSPNMLTVNTHQPLWRVLYRAACLCALGFDVMWLPYSEWEAALARNVEEEYLLSRLSALLSGPADAASEIAEQPYLPSTRFLV